VIDYLTGQQTAHNGFAVIARQGVAISTVTFSEIYEGILGSHDPKAAEVGFAAFVQGVRVIGVGRRVARRNAEIRLALRQKKRPITHRALDLLIAATALTHDLTVVTRNTNDYSDVPGIKLDDSNSL
jgi:predicted nucleic acid-binding protein